MNAAVEHGVPAISMLGNGGVSATLAVGNGVGSVLSGLGNAAVEHGAPAGRMIANGLGSATVALGNGVGQSLTGLANVAAEHGPPLAKAAIDGLAWLTKALKPFMPYTMPSSAYRRFPRLRCRSTRVGTRWSPISHFET